MKSATTSQMLPFDEMPYDPEDAEAVADFWEGATISHQGRVIGKATRGKQREAVKIAVSIRLSPDVLEYFKRGGDGWQTRLDDVLKSYVADHQQAA
ncbi:BrnA antitoxin family protein [Thiothrix subterranea]|uniref:BrnA antitoxin family protein n=1 Tax=Thiothrix subterranea TaxID=2735563 RepID=A0AA51MKY4_9GAMM|nr:BrnA antitoxin family protein [Thiothrix subterranea]MDQ5770258.1 BrnA antitoxin family protein [Thiothrix subterranea]WML85800.1 BrnA antitoxin family protein [Thiothrix subterranea]